MKDKIETPLIIVNFKTYLEATGQKAIELAKKAENVSYETGVTISLAPQITDISAIVKAVKNPVLAQHIDPINPGSHTGHILIDAVKQAGAIGSLINHSERQLRLSDIEFLIGMARKKNMISVVCANNPDISVAVASLRPDMIAIEPPELIGTGIPVSKAKPEVIEDTIKQVRRINKEVTILCGAGISHGDDVEASIKLGTDGVLVASAVVKANDPFNVLLEFSNSIKV